MCPFCAPAEETTQDLKVSTCDPVLFIPLCPFIPHSTSAAINVSVEKLRPPKGKTKRSTRYLRIASLLYRFYQWGENLSLCIFDCVFRNAMSDQQLTSLHTVFVIIYLQEFAWIMAPLLISANVFLHAVLKKVNQGETEWLLLATVVFAFFLLTGLAVTISLFIVHSKALGQKRPTLFLPYIVTKLVRMIIMGTVSLVILLTPELIIVYFYASIYGLFETAAGAIALEVTFRSWRVLKKSSVHSRRRQSSSDAPPTLGLSKQTLVATSTVE